MSNSRIYVELLDTEVDTILELTAQRRRVAPGLWYQGLGKIEALIKEAKERQGRDPQVSDG